MIERWQDRVAVSQDSTHAPSVLVSQPVTQPTNEPVSQSVSQHVHQPVTLSQGNPESGEKKPDAHSAEALVQSSFLLMQQRNKQKSFALQAESKALTQQR